MSGDDHNNTTDTNWRVEVYDSAWGGWRTVEGGNGLTEKEAKAHVRRLGSGTTFKYRARLGVAS